MLKRVAIAGALVLLGLQRAQGAYLGEGIDAAASFYQPRDSRFRGEGLDLGFQLKVANALSLGYRVEFLEAEGRDVVAGAPVSGTGHAISQGLTAYVRTLESAHERIGVDLGLWAGELVDSPAAGATTILPLASPFVEPLGRVTYRPRGDGGSFILLGLGYRFVRGFTSVPHPFGGTSLPLNDYDGLDLSLGVGVTF